MVDAADLEVNLLEFVRKSFAFDRRATVEGREFAVFRRTETESEAKFRPKVVHLLVVVPLDWVVYDLAADLLAIGRDGVKPGPRGTGAATEAAAEKTEFTEQGVAWHRENVPGVGFVYLPAELLPGLLAPAARAELGLA